MFFLIWWHMFASESVCQSVSPSFQTGSGVRHVWFRMTRRRSSILTISEGQPERLCVLCKSACLFVCMFVSVPRSLFTGAARQATRALKADRLKPHGFTCVKRRRRAGNCPTWVSHLLCYICYIYIALGASSCCRLQPVRRRLRLIIFVNWTKKAIKCLNMTHFCLR